MKKRWNIFLCTALCFALVALIGLTAGKQPKASAATYEEKIYCDATLEDDFAEYTVLVSLTKSFSKSGKLLTEKDLPQPKLNPLFWKMWMMFGP